MDKNHFQQLTLVDLRKEAQVLGLEKVSRLKKSELIERLLRHQKAENSQEKAETDEKEESVKKPSSDQVKKNENERSPYYKIKDSMDNVIVVAGRLEIVPEGYGFVKNADMVSQEDHVYISGSQIQKFKLETGDHLSGKVRTGQWSEDGRYYQTN